MNFQNQNGFAAHKQFTMSTQHGLFPKIMNLRVEQNQTVPNSAHSNGHGNQMQQAGSNQITSAAAMNILKHSGGHISGMSTHHHGQHNLAALNDRQHSRGVPMGSADGEAGRRGRRRSPLRNESSVTTKTAKAATKSTAERSSC